MRIDHDRLASTLADLVRIPSVNPYFDPESGGEAAVAEHLEAVLRQEGMEVARHEPEPGRVSVVGRLRGAGGGPSLLLYAHLDTVGTEGMEDAPFDPRVDDGRMHGRGAYDMKCGLAAAVEAVRALREAGVRLRGDLLVVGVADEEVASRGMEEVLRHHRADAAIVTEPTEMETCVAHKGFRWIEVVVEGRAAHGSRFQDGIDANMLMGRFLARLDALERDVRARAPHPLVGPPSLHAATLHGGTGTSTYAASCRLEVERRTVPGETEADVLAEVRAIVDALAGEDDTFRATVRPLLTRGGWEARPDSPIVAAVQRAGAAVLGEAPPRFGAPYWMDTALMAEAGIDCVVLGPAGEGAHAAVEWVDLASVARCADVYARAAAEYCGVVEG